MTAAERADAVLPLVGLAARVAVEGAQVKVTLVAVQHIPVDAALVADVAVAHQVFDALPQVALLEPKSVISVCFFVEILITNSILIFCELHFLMTAIRNMVLQIFCYQQVARLPTNYRASNDRFGFKDVESVRAEKK